MIWIILALLFSVAMTIVTLIRMYRYKAENERLHLKNGGLIIANGDLELELEKTKEQCSKDATAQAERMVTLLAENGALNLKLKEALKPRTRGKAKMSQEEL